MERKKRRDTSIMGVTQPFVSEMEVTIVKIEEGKLEIRREENAIPYVRGLEGNLLPCKQGLVSAKLEAGATIRVSLQPLTEVEKAQLFEVIRGETEIIGLYR